ncbi:MAG: hypothetical protein Q4E32_03195 [Bacteroidales bacterium]|nr:hypothetical protein [Bacteroidales bacterium]
MEPHSFSTTYVPLQPPYQIIKYNEDVAIQIGTLIVTIQKIKGTGVSHFGIETHSYPVVSYANKFDETLADKPLISHEFLEGAVWNNVEVRDVKTICFVGATLTWENFMAVLEHESQLHGYRLSPDISIYWRLRKLGVVILPPEVRDCTIDLSLMIQPEEVGLSLQSVLNPHLFLNVSVAEDDDERENVYWIPEELEWNSHEWIDDEFIWHSLEQQLSMYRFVLRDLLIDEKVNHFNVTYKTDEKRFKWLVDRLNKTDHCVNLAYVS